MIETVSQWLIELVSDLVGAVLASICCVVDEIACPTAREEGVHILAARLARGRAEGVELRGGADDWAVVEFGYDLYNHQLLLGKEVELNLPCLQPTL